VARPYTLISAMSKKFDWSELSRHQSVGVALLRRPLFVATP
jgi:hypothetical protein